MIESGQKGRELMCNKDDVIGKLGENPGSAYMQQLKDLSYCWSYVKDRLSGFNRYEFFTSSANDPSAEEERALGLGIGNKLAHQMLMTPKGLDLIPHKGAETLPEPTAKAHTESGMWRSKVADSLKVEFLKVFNSLYGSGRVS